MSASRPNILLIMADQLSAAVLGCYGHPLCRTPHIDALAARGARFERAYCNSPICAPSRASLATGRLVTRIDAFDNGTPFGSDVPTFMHHLRRAGYQTILSGKAHFIGPDQHHGYERRLTPEIYPSSFVWTPDWTRGAYHNPGTAVDQLAWSGICDWSLQLDHDEEVHYRALEALRDLARGEDARPWLLTASYTHPHEPFIITRDWWDLYDHDAIDPPAAPAEPLESMHPYNRWLSIHHMIDVHPPSEEHVRNARHAYLGMVSYFDAKVGDLIAETERLGFADDTVVILVSDHGEMLGEHGMWFKRTFYEPSVRVPWIVAGPGIEAGLAIEETASLVDLAPTLLDLAGLDDLDEVTADLDGESLAMALEGEPPPAPHHAIIEYCSEGVCQPLRAVVRGDLKYVHVLDQPELLYDLGADPLELRDLAADDRYRDQLDALRALVHHGYDAVSLRERILESQRRRRYVNEAMDIGQPRSWDAPVDIDPRHTYVRRYDAQETSRRRRI